MKHNLVIISCALLTFSSCGTYAFAGAAGGGATEVTQIMNNAELIPVNISDAATAINTGLDSAKNTIADPIANGLIAGALQTTADDILSWVNGGMGGAPLIVSDPQEYINSQGLTAARRALSSIPDNSTYGDSIFDSLLGSYQDISVKEKIASETRSNIPVIVQNNICLESRLTSLANDRATNADGVIDEAQAAVEKEYLYGYACLCDPINDDECSAKLMDLYEQNPSLGGDEAWLRLTGGDNPFVKTENVKAVVREDVEQAKTLALEDMKGLGTVSEKKCLQLEEDAAGNTFCAKEAVVTPGKTVQSALDFAATAGPQRLLNVMNTGSLTSVLTGYLDKSLFKGLNQGIAALSGGSNNAAKTTVASAPLKQDLAADPTKKDEVLASINKSIDFNLGTISKLEEVDSDYRALIRSYRPKVEQVKACFDSLVSRNLAVKGDANVTSAYTYYNTRMSRINAVEEILAADVTLIAQARDFTNATKNKLANSNSSKEISNIYNAYTSDYEKLGYPNMTSESVRKSSFTKDSSDARLDKENEDLMKTCSQLEQPLWGFGVPN